MAFGQPVAQGGSDVVPPSGNRSVPVRTLLIDNYDSYTFNLFQLLANVNGELPIVLRNDQLSWEEIQSQISFDNIVLSPGPGRPENPSDFGVCRDALLKADVPVLGVCLGHQGLADVFGGKVVHATEVMHGRSSAIYHTSSVLFRNIPQGFSVVRYHSLVVDPHLPECLTKTAWTSDDVIMGIQHVTRPLFGVQFHPESICTDHGRTLMTNFRDVTALKRVASGDWSEQMRRFSVVPGATSVPLSVPSSINNPPPPPKYRTHVLKLDRTRLSQMGLDVSQSERVFVNLYGKDLFAFWLDSSRVEPGLSRFSYMGPSDGPLSVFVKYDLRTTQVTLKPRPSQSEEAEESVVAHSAGFLDWLEKELSLRRCGGASDSLPFEFNGGFVGYLGYELKEECMGQTVTRGCRTSVHVSPYPDAAFLLADRVIAFDHEEGHMYLMSVTHADHLEDDPWLKETESHLTTLPPLPPLSPSSSSTPSSLRTPPSFVLGRSARDYSSDVKACLSEIHEGESYEICLTNQISTEASPDPITLYRTLRRLNPAPFAAFLRFGKDLAICCSSPERFLLIDRGRWVESKPIKGTIKRGRTEEEDKRLWHQLNESVKDHAENLMIVDLLRNDLGLVCEVGTVHVPKLMAIETYATVHTMVSTVRGHLRDNISTTKCIQMAFPGGSMTGAPKRRTLDILDRLEVAARGIYSGAIGFLALNGAAELNICIRTAVVTPECTTIGAGGAIVAQSEPNDEFEEMLLKAKAIMRAINIVETDSDPEFGFKVRDPGTDDVTGA
mmetsp:Transcript_25888/g.42529  ORF Transcript_25888/g.42529 Transcript_25888/m.42529 type:complete len:780 (+) Transcript_25888:172-2511(+)|eukprot:CAMPEP_0184333550 /NCGR_PEP_ID=MMETSP1089-20130417/2517_1 /TAXON_ID=38269 ORGANISM="Gloeochaete wittrockiana, Strain SAG46.84" /NCGR_SAMPLE_ID=MMETSP1089 /ASSEMBLY_ACC=CAM_ASM_000445 /LENGTH=779 /DNA_ID=CAMNT_0026657411 /DNA_START=76 /DNA_END=2415 /DNA_ORIENTATION=+